jgi:serum/glucocorticoid-regulated kinase 2
MTMIGTFEGTADDISEPHAYLLSSNPVIRGDADMMNLLLAHGADPNVGYHDPSFDLLDSRPLHVKCGRVIQLAMELGHRDLGADLAR